MKQLTTAEVVPTVTDVVCGISVIYLYLVKFHLLTFIDRIILDVIHFD